MESGKSLVIPADQPPTVKTMSATPDVVRNLFEVALLARGAEFRAFAKIITGFAVTFMLASGVFWSLDVLRLGPRWIGEGGGLAVRLFLGFLVGFLWGLPEFLAAREALSAIPHVKQRLWESLEIALNDMLDTSLDLDGDGVAERSDYVVHDYREALRQDGVAAVAPSKRLILKEPFPPALGITHKQAMEFIKLGVREGFSRDAVWCVVGKPNRVLLDGTPEKLEVTRPVYDQMMSALSALGVVKLVSRQKGYQMAMSIGEARRLLFSLVALDEATR